MKYLRSEHYYNIYEFQCPGCGATGELGVPKASQKAFNHECGCLFIQHSPVGMFAEPRLEVVCSHD